MKLVRVLALAMFLFASTDAFASIPKIDVNNSNYRSQEETNGGTSVEFKNVQDAEDLYSQIVECLAEFDKLYKNSNIVVNGIYILSTDVPEEILMDLADIIKGQNTISMSGVYLYYDSTSKVYVDEGDLEDMSLDEWNEFCDTYGLKLSKQDFKRRAGRFLFYFFELL